MFLVICLFGAWNKHNEHIPQMVACFMLVMNPIGSQSVKDCLEDGLPVDGCKWLCKCMVNNHGDRVRPLTIPGVIPLPNGRP